MRDYGHDETERLISEMEKKVADVYRQSEKELSDKLDDYLKKFETKDAIWQKNVADGKRTLEEYQQWQKGQMLAGYRWQAMRDQVAEDMHNSNAVARSIVMGYRPEAYAINHNFATYQVEKAARVNTGYTLYSRETVERILRDQPELLPAPGSSMQKKLHDYKMKTGKDIAWQKGQIQSVMTQAVIQGESIPNISKRIAETLGEMNHKATIRYARTAITGAQNAGRIDAYRRAAEMGIGVKRQWVATIDFRTRHEHRMLDGEVVEVDEPFKVDGYEIMFPGDPAAEPYLIWNCRCTTIPVVDGLSNDFSGRSDDAIQGMSYDDWKESRYEESHSITKQEEIAELMKRRYINELYSGGGSGTAAANVVDQAEETPQVRSFEFTPASTIQEAEEYAMQFVDESRFGAVGVSYTGVSLDVANEVNRTVGKFMNEFDVEKFGGILAPAGNTKLGKLMTNATAGYVDIRRSIFLNRKSLKTMDTAKKALQAEQKALNDLLQHPERYDFSKASRQLVRVVENSKISGRATVPETIEEVLNHELGHSLERKVTKSELWEKAKANMTEFGGNVSGYACEDASEYIAESFCSYMKGESVIDPVMRKIFEGLRR